MLNLSQVRLRCRRAPPPQSGARRCVPQDARPRGRGAAVTGGAEANQPGVYASSDCLLRLRRQSCSRRVHSLIDLSTDCSPAGCAIPRPPMCSTRKCCPCCCHCCCFGSQQWRMLSQALRKLTKANKGAGKKGKKAASKAKSARQLQGSTAAAAKRKAASSANNGMEDSPAYETLPNYLRSQRLARAACVRRDGTGRARRA